MTDIFVDDVDEGCWVGGVITAKGGEETLVVGRFDVEVVRRFNSAC
jgi:hypothetical protein